MNNFGMTPQTYYRGMTPQTYYRGMGSNHILGFGAPPLMLLLMVAVLTVAAVIIIRWRAALARR